MGIYAGLDVSIEAVAICVVCETGEVLWQGEVLGEPESVTGALRQWRDDLVLVGLEADATSEWIAGHLVDGGFPVVCLESRHVKAALSAMTVKTDRNDARDCTDCPHRLVQGSSSEVRCRPAAAHTDGGSQS
ncbi:MAG: hypothetical protein EOR33_32075 [Mesorhizobium sp.]|uniref:IS110 family transposase n=1 Tax=Mesorhizobium sp. TaxID=1871066 RepID=UPI000FE39DA8|nr:transposase [Mesorhizobium sp.]RWI83843.1 MAG: hypothetical protein EOR20_20620 [Mesorhizobium sp.]RWJ58762.1 MAG: hypothetical protein EOR33_32075 [Mesorhizobium sp.]